VNRRFALPFIASFAAAPLLAGCSIFSNGTTSGGTGIVTVPVTLAGAQAQAVAILNGLVKLNAEVGGALSASARAVINEAIAVLTAAVNAFAALPAGANWVTLAETVVKGISGVLAVLPLPAGANLLIAAGTMVLNGLLAGLSTLTVTVAPPTPAGSVSAVAPPIPIVVGASLKAVLPPIPITV
jgi:hypothetical protein